MSKRNIKITPTKITDVKTYFSTLKTNILLLKSRSIEQIYSKYIEFNKSENLNNNQKKLLINVIESINWEDDVNKKTKEKLENIIKNYENKILDEKNIYFEGSKYNVYTKTYRTDLGIKYELIFDSNINETIYNIFTRSKVYLGINTNFISKVVITYKNKPSEFIPKGQLTFEKIEEILNEYPELKTKHNSTKSHSYQISEIKKLIKKDAKPDIIDLNRLFVSYYRKKMFPLLDNGNIIIEIYEESKINNILH